MIVKAFLMPGFAPQPVGSCQPIPLRIPNSVGCGYVFREMMPGVAGSRDMR
jgi:hypothetical protein